MKSNLTQTPTTMKPRTILTTALLLTFTFIIAAPAMAQIPTPVTDSRIAPPQGATAFALGRAVGTQGYVCLPTATGGASWTVNGARPEATLFTSIFGKDVQFITHFTSPNANPNGNATQPLPFGNATWQSSFDTSKVWAAAQSGHAVLPAADQPNCPNTGSIACLLLQSVGNQQGPTGGKFLANVSFVQRLNTKGGSAPTEGCSVAADVGKQALVPYTADYFFYRGGEQQN